MSTYRLDRLFTPRSVAVVGGSPRPKSLVRAILRNLRGAGFAGPVTLVNDRYPEIDGVAAVPSLRALAEPPDVAVIALPAARVPAAVAEAAECGVAAAVIITAGLGHGPGSLAAACDAAARRHGLRLIGPNCLGVLAPFAKFNASFAAHMPPAGDLALLSQSGAVAAGMIEWASRRAVGFSAVVSIGDQLDVDFGDLLDYFALDRCTRAILLYVEQVKDARKFMSAARAAARGKPVVVVKAGRHAAAARAAATHTGALAGSDAVYDAAFRRAGLLRVADLGELFEAAETLGRLRAVRGDRLAILTNGGGVGVLALDRLIDLAGTPASISSTTRARLDAVLPPTWSHGNPIDIVGDADADRYREALEALLADDENDAVLVLNVETAAAAALDSASAVVAAVEAQRLCSVAPKPVLAVWVGAEADVAGTFSRAGIPHFADETAAVRGFSYLTRHADAVRTLMETPPSLPQQFTPDVAAARAVVAGVLAAGRRWLDPLECGALLAAYSIPTMPTTLARDPAAAEAVARPLLAAGQAVAVKIMSHDIVHKSDVGGVRLNLVDAAAVRAAAAEVIARAKAARPEAHIAGVIVQPMVVRPKARELIAGLAEDATFGPVVVFGHGGTAVEVIDDKALALPPLDRNLARDLVRRTRISRLLAGYRDVPPARIEEVELTLVKLAQLAADLPEVVELDINPLIADETGILALDARVAVAPPAAKFRGRGHPRFAVRPYPSEWERRIVLGADWRILVRPVRPEDEDLVREFFRHVTSQDLRLRFFAPVKDFGHTFIARLTQLDYARARAFIAIDEANGQMIGGVRLHADADYKSGEYAILLRSDLKGRGLGWRLMELIIEYGRAEGLACITGQVLRENTSMLRMCSELGFAIEDDPSEESIVIVSLPLAQG